MTLCKENLPMLAGKARQRTGRKVHAERKCGCMKVKLIPKQKSGAAQSQQRQPWGLGLCFGSRATARLLLESRYAGILLIHVALLRV